MGRNNPPPPLHATHPRIEPYTPAHRGRPLRSFNTMDSEAGAGPGPGPRGGGEAGAGAGTGARDRGRGRYRSQGPGKGSVSEPGTGEQAGTGAGGGGSPVAGPGVRGVGNPATLRFPPHHRGYSRSFSPDFGRSGREHPRGLGVEAGSKCVSVVSPPFPPQGWAPCKGGKKSGFLRVNLLRLFSLKSIKD